MMRAMILVGVLAALLPAAAGAQPQDFASCYRRGMSQLSQGASNQAASTLQSCVSAAHGNVSDPTIYTNLAWAQIQAGRPNDARGTLILAQQHKAEFRPAEWAKVQQNQQLLARMPAHR